MTNEEHLWQHVRFFTIIDIGVAVISGTMVGFEARDGDLTGGLLAAVICGAVTFAVIMTLSDVRRVELEHDPSPSDEVATWPR